MKGSFWLEAGAPEYSPLERDARADVAVLGGGIAGVTTALMLAEAGADVVLLEAARVGHGVTGHTTAKVTSQHGLIYDTLRSRFGVDTAHAYGAANQAALEWISRRVQDGGIDCDLRRRAAYAYAASDSERSDVESEAEAAREAGLPATFVETTPLPYPVAGAVRFDDQAEFHVHRYLTALAAAFVAAGGTIHEHSRAVEVDADGECVVKTAGGRLSAERVVVATHYPFLDRSLAFARLTPQRSYAIVCRIAGTPPEGMFITAGSPTRSVRGVLHGGEELLLVGGEGHRTGTGGDTEEHYRALEEFARAHWDVRSVEFRWSAQDNTTADGIPYVGALTPFGDRVLMATGFAKWGMTGGTAAAIVLSDRILGRENAWADLFDPNRLNLRTAVPSLLKKNAEVGLHFIGDRLRRPTRTPADLRPGEGDLVRHAGETVAAYRAEDGTLTAVSPTCTHLGCRVAFNTAERSWDCPATGRASRPTARCCTDPPCTASSASRSTEPADPRAGAELRRQVLAQVLSGQRPVGLHQRVRRAREDDLAAVVARAGAHVDHLVGAATTSRSCSITITERPRSTSPSSRSTSLSTSSMCSPVVGSSSTSTSLARSTSIASLIRWRSPPDSVVSGWPSRT